MRSWPPGPLWRVWPQGLTHSNARVRVGRLDQLLALVTNDPVGVDLCGPLRVQMHHLEVPEVGFADGVVLRTHVVNVRDAVVVKIVFTDVTPPIT